VTDTGNGRTNLLQKRTMIRSRLLSRWVREPLLHFLVLGLALFLVFQWIGDGRGERRIVVSPGRVEALAAAFARTWQRPPTPAELGGLIDDYVREEIATREALFMGLDRDDTVIRRRLRQKLEFLVEDSVDASPPTDADLAAWLERHSDAFRVEARVALRQVYFSPEKRGDSAPTNASAALAKLAPLGASADTSGFGDPIMLPVDVPLSSRSAIANEFGENFAQRVLEVDTGKWEGPVESAYGLHLVFVQQREQAYLPRLAEIRPAVEREVLADRRKENLREMYEKLLGRYEVIIEPDGGGR
jgi:hypothetical protein